MKTFVKALLVLFYFLAAGCAYNVREISAKNLQGPAREVAVKEKIEIPEDPVFSMGFVNNRFLETGKYQVVLAPMPGGLMRELSAYTVAWHHVAAYNVKTRMMYHGQALYYDKVGGFDARIPCGRYVAIVIEGLENLDTETRKNMRVVFGNTHADHFFDLKGNPISFTQQEYMSGKWDVLAKVRVSLNDAPAYFDSQDLNAVKQDLQGWSQYDISDSGSEKKWRLLTPYVSDKDGEDIVSQVARINPNYSISDKLRTALENGFVLSPNYFGSVAGLVVAMVEIPFMKERKPHQNETDAIIARLDSLGPGNCSAPRIYVPVLEEMARSLHNGGM